MKHLDFDIDLHKERPASFRESKKDVRKPILNVICAVFFIQAGAFFYIFYLFLKFISTLRG